MYEIMESYLTLIIIDKPRKNIFYVNGSDLRIVYTLLSSETAKSKEVIKEKIKTRSNELMIPS